MLYRPQSAPAATALCRLIGRKRKRANYRRDRQGSAANTAATTPAKLIHRKRLMIDGERKIYLCFVLICGNHEPFNRLALNESIHNLRDIRSRNAPVKKVIRFD